MVPPKLGNCPNCGKLYLRTRNICPACLQKQEDDFLKTSEYLRKFPGCSIQELSDATDVSTGQIRQFIRSGRIIAGKFPNLSYPCEICGGKIHTGRICNNCSKAAMDLKGKVDGEREKRGNDEKRSANGYIKYL